MSGPDETEGDKGFLSRWSQRKLEAKQPEQKPVAPAAESNALAPAPPGEEAPPEFDLSSLPKLEELTGTSDISAFLRKGVPEHLRNAALRKSWALDPAIRNYVSPALEYAYDWNTPGGVPGGGELGAGIDVARMVKQIMGEPAAEPVKSDANAANDAVAPSPPESDVPIEPQAELSPDSVRFVDDANAKSEGVAEAQDAKDGTLLTNESAATGTFAPQQPVRRHGSAKPIV
jgi:hypothetical protein